MKITFDQTVEDVAAFAHYHNANMGIGKWVRYIFLGVLLICVTVIIVSGWSEGQMSKDAVSSVLPAIIVSTIFLFIFSKKSTSRRVKQLAAKKGNENLVGTREIEFSEQYFHLKTTLTEFKMSWQKALKLKETKDHLFLYIAPNEAIPIPKRIFLLEQELHDVKEFIERKMRA